MLGAAQLAVTRVPKFSGGRAHAAEEEAQLLVGGNALAGGLGLDQGPAALAEIATSEHRGCARAAEEEAQLLVRGNALAGGLGLDQGPAALAEKEAFLQLKAVRRLLRSEARRVPQAPLGCQGPGLSGPALMGRVWRLQRQIWG